MDELNSSKSLNPFSGEYGKARRDVRNMAGASNSRSFSTLWAIVKPMLLYPAGLYLLGFGLFPTAKGLEDWLLPFEQAGCVVLGVAFLGWFVVSYYKAWAILRRR